MNKALYTELLTGCAMCGRRFVDAKSKPGKKLKYLTSPNTVSVGDKSMFVCNRCMNKCQKCE